MVGKQNGGCYSIRDRENSLSGISFSTSMVQTVVDHSHHNTRDGHEQSIVLPSSFLCSQNCFISVNEMKKEHLILHVHI